MDHSHNYQQHGKADMGKKITSVDRSIPYRQFLGPNEIDLRGLGFTLGFAMRGPEPESSTPATRLALSQQITAAFARFNLGDMVDIIFHRLRAPHPPARNYPSKAAQLVDQEHRSIEHWSTKARLYLSHNYPHPLWSWLHTLLFSAHRRAATREQTRQEAHQRFTSVLDAIAGELHLTALDSSAMLRDFNLIINGIDMPILLPDESVRLNHVLANQDQTNGREPIIGRLHQRPVTIDIYPTTTYPQMLATLLNESGEMMLCCRYIAREPYDTQSDLRKIRKDWENMDLGRMSDIIFQAIGYDAGTRRNQSARQMIDELDHEVMPEASQGMPFGWQRIVAVIRDVNPQRCEDRAHDCVRNMNHLGISARIEDVYASEVLEECWPGNPTESVREPHKGPRQPFLKASTFVNLVLPSEPWPGTEYIESEFFAEPTPAPLVGTGTFNWPTHSDGVGNQLWVGMTGSGKSTFMNSLTCGLTGIPNARTYRLDLDYSSFITSYLLGADYHDVGAPDSPGINPLDVLDEPNGIGWLVEWCRRIFTRWNQPLGADQVDDLRYALWKAHRDGVRSLRYLQGYLDKDHENLKTILLYYSDGGFYGHVFDHQGGDSLRIGTTPIGVYELRSLTLLGKLAAAPAIELILHSIINSMDGTPTWLFFDELWWFLQDETSAEFLFDAIGSVRKRGGCFVGATPSTVELANSPFCARLLVNCPGQVFFANHMLRTGDAHVTEQYRQLGVPDHLIATIGSARRKRELLYREPEHARLAAFRLGRVAQRICGATGFNDIKRFRQLVAAHGHDRDAVLAAWLAD